MIRTRSALRSLALLGVLVLVGCDSSRSDFEQASKAHTENAFERYIEKHPQAKQTPAAVEELRLLRWQAAEQSGNLPRLESYVANYPAAPNLAQATALLERLAWDATKASADPKQVERHIARFPGSPHDADARALLDTLLWETAVRSGEMEPLRRYVVASPTSERASQAADRMKDMAKAEAKVARFDCSRVFSEHAHIARKDLPSADPLPLVAPGRYSGAVKQAMRVELQLAASGAASAPQLRAFSVKGRNSHFEPAENGHLRQNDQKTLLVGSEVPAGVSFCLQVITLETEFSGASVTQLGSINMKQTNAGAYFGTVLALAELNAVSVRLIRVGDAFPRYVEGVAALISLGDAPLDIPEEAVFEARMPLRPAR